jgi:hypothetical protein
MNTNNSKAQSIKEHNKILEDELHSFLKDYRLTKPLSKYSHRPYIEQNVFIHSIIHIFLVNKIKNIEKDLLFEKVTKIFISSRILTNTFRVYAGNHKVRVFEEAIKSELILLKKDFPEISFVLKTLTRSHEKKEDFSFKFVIGTKLPTIQTLIPSSNSINLLN